MPVRVFLELGHAVARHDNLEAFGRTGLQVNRCHLAHTLYFVCRWVTEDVVARNDVLRAQRRPVVVAVLLVVEQAQLLQALHAAEGAVGDDYLQVGVGVL